MSAFKVAPHLVEILPHPNADRLEMAKIGGYLSIVPKGIYRTGDSCIYIPEQSIVPESILEELGLVGKLKGKQFNRVSALRLRGIVSQGLIYPNKHNWENGVCVADTLGITKYMPEVPEDMIGALVAVGHDYTLNYDIENIKTYPNILQEGEPVQITEKLHGTFIMVTAIPSTEFNAQLIQGRFAVSSKGFGAQGLAFDDTPENFKNIYLRAAKELNLFEKVGALADHYGCTTIIAGEIFGAVQDLKYGTSNKNTFRLFDIAIGEERSTKRYLDHHEVEQVCQQYGIERVPVLYVGEFNQSLLLEYTSGLETVSGQGLHIREGVVIKPLTELYSMEIGRVILKSINDEYLFREGGTEYN